MDIRQKTSKFYAEASKGYIIKVLVDVLSGALSRTIFRINRKGIFIRESDLKSHILFDVSLYRENFKVFRCSKENIFSLNLKHLQKMIRNIKKKDSIVLFIDPKRPNKLGVNIRPEGYSNAKPTRNETIYISINIETDIDNVELPEIVEINGSDKDVYGYPMVVGANDFQKIKKIANVGPEVSVKMQKNNYISFFCDSDIYSTEIEFGELLENPETDSCDDDESDSDDDELKIKNLRLKLKQKKLRNNTIAYCISPVDK